MTDTARSCMENKLDTYSGAERRRHKRFRVKDNALVFFGKDTGTILDISQGGLSVHYAALEKKTALPNYLDIFFVYSRFYLPNLPVSLVDEMPILPNPIFNSFQVKRLRMKFGPLSSEQHARLEDFITDNAILES